MVIYFRHNQTLIENNKFLDFPYLMKRQKSHDDSKIHEEYLDEETEQLMKRTDTLNTNTSTKNLFQFFFEKALGPKAAPPKIK